MFQQRSLLLGILLIANWATTISAVKLHDFKTCSQAGFCRRGRALSARSREAKDWQSPYSVDADSVVLSGSSFTASVRSSLYPDIKFKLDLNVLQNGVIRARMDQVEGLKKRYGEAASWALISEPALSSSIQWTKSSKDIRAKYGPKSEIEARVAFNPLRISLSRNGKEEVVVNGDGLLHMEHFRAKPEPEPVAEESAGSEESATETPEGEATPAVEENNAQKVMERPPSPQSWFEGDTEEDLWEEQFSTWKDSKPKGIQCFSSVNLATVI